MQSKVSELRTLLPPPTDPRNNSGDWEVVESSLGTRLPRDYKEFTELYGTVKICNYLVIHTAFPWDTAFKDFLLSQSGQYDAVVNGRARVCHPDFPKLGGLLGIAGTDNGDIISWITEGDPDEWGIFVWIFPGIETFAFEDHNLSSLLLSIVDMSSPLFPDHLPDTFFLPENRNLFVTN